MIVTCNLLSLPNTLLRCCQMASSRKGKPRVVWRHQTKAAKETDRTITPWYCNVTQCTWHLVVTFMCHDSWWIKKMVIFYARPRPSEVCVSISLGNILFVPCSYQNQKISFHVTCHFVNKGHGSYSIKRPTSNKRPPPFPPPALSFPCSPFHKRPSWRWNFFPDKAYPNRYLKGLT